MTSIRSLATAAMCSRACTPVNARLSDNAVLSALRRMGFPRDEMTGHGFRAMARTLLAERLTMDEAIIELKLAHAVKDRLGRAYNRTEFLGSAITWPASA